MALLKSRKEEMIKDLENRTKDAKSLVFVNFHGMNVSQESALRKDLRQKNVDYTVFRKTLLKRALSGKAEGEIPSLDGEVAIAFSTDPTAPAREVYEFGKSNGGVLKILGGIFEGKFVDGAFMSEIATIPSKEVLLSKLAFLLQSPMQRIAIAINEVSKKKA